MRTRMYALLIISLSLSSCSVYMASTGSDAVDISVLKIGATKSDVESVLGKPTASLRKDTPEGVVSYQYFTGDEANYKRAALYGALDIATLGISEVVFTPVEALQGDKHIVEIQYDKHRVVQSYNVYFQKAPLDKPHTIVCSKCMDLGIYSPVSRTGASVAEQKPEPVLQRFADAPTPRTPPTRAAMAEMVSF